MKLQCLFSELVEEPKDVIATLGSAVVMRCSTSVSTVVSCTWKHNKIVISKSCSNNHSLTLPNVSLSDEGSYTCEIMGNAGKPVISTVKLELPCIMYVNNSYHIVENFGRRKLWQIAR